MSSPQRPGRPGYLLALALAMVLTSCGVAGIGAPDAGATRVTTWSAMTATTQAHRMQWEDPRLRTRLIESDAERDEVLATLPDALPRADVEMVRAIGLDEFVIVLAVYHRCDETSSLDLDDGVLRLVIERGGAQCAWAPVQVEAWSVPRENLPDPVVFHDQRGEPD